MEIFQDVVIILNVVIILDMEAKHHTIVHRTSISRRKNIYHRSYKNTSLKFTGKSPLSRALSAGHKSLHLE